MSTSDLDAHPRLAARVPSECYATRDCASQSTISL